MRSRPLELREQFIAVLGHDLRNPLTSVNMGADSLLRRPLGESERKTVERIRASGRRMSSLVADLLDFARAKLGAGVGLALEDVADLGGALRHVVAELESAHPDREVRLTIDCAGPVRCDRERLGQLLSNLVANALEHGAPDRPVDVRVVRSGDRLELSVQNEGAPISWETRARLFRPYSRGDHGDREGLGLGLYIASEIAKAHGGSLEVRSSAAEGTRFSASLPVAPVR